MAKLSLAINNWNIPRRPVMMRVVTLRNLIMRAMLALFVCFVFLEKGLGCAHEFWWLKKWAAPGSLADLFTSAKM